jgi:hypothetical protein
MVRRRGDELCLRRAPLLLELLLGPAARDNDPFPGFCRACGRADALHRLRYRLRADPVHFGRVEQSGPDRVHVGIDQAGNHGAPAELDHLSLGSRELADFGVAADRKDFPVADRERFLGCSTRKRHDLAAEQDRVSVLRERRRSAERQAEQEAAYAR